MDSLLRWGIENSSTGSTVDAATEPPKPIDPAIIDMILGRPDSELMKESLQVALDETLSSEERVTALDNLEMLVEQIDNANNLTPLKMWESLIRLSGSSADEVRLNALWVLGTAIQNNTKAQETYLSHDPLPAILVILSSPDGQASAETRSKAMYCLSAALKHNAPAVRRFASLDGWGVLKQSLSDSSVIVRRKAAFLLNSLLLQDGDEDVPLLPSTTAGSANVNLPALFPSSSPTHTNGLTRKALRSSGIFTTLLLALASPTPTGPDGDEGPDPDFEEKGVRVILTLLQMDGERLNMEEKTLLHKALTNKTKSKGIEDWGLAGDEWSVLEKGAQE